MAFFEKVNKFISYIPIIRGIVDIIIGAYRGICGALENPSYDKQKFLDDATIDIDDYIQEIEKNE